MSETLKGPLFVIAIVLLVAILFGFQAATGKKWKKGFGSYEEVVLDDSTRAFYKWVAMVALVVAVALAVYTLVALR